MVVYGATPGGVVAAVAAARDGAEVVLVEPSGHVGGVVSGGLTVSDVGRFETVGGISREFFDRVLRRYTEKYGADSQQVKDCRSGTRFEPRVAEAEFGEMLREQAGIGVRMGLRLVGVDREGTRVTGLRVERSAGGTGSIVRGRIFIDASYEGDLMAGAGIECRVGRESRAEFGESLAGINAGPPETIGKGDGKVQAYNYRVCLTSREDNRMPIARPDRYDPSVAESYVRRVLSGSCDAIEGLFHEKFESWRVPNDKIDANIGDWPGGNEGYVGGDAATRARIEVAHRDRTLSILHRLQNDTTLPVAFRATANRWGLPKDEFPDNGHFPRQIYVREARRLVGGHVLREKDVRFDRHKWDGICLGSYMIDCHSVQIIRSAGGLRSEGGMAQPTKPYEIPYRCLTPKDVQNVLVPVCASATHVAWCSLRMEPVFMMLGHAAGVAARQAIAAGKSVQEIDVGALRDRLRAQGQLLDAPFEPRVDFEWDPPSPTQGKSITFKVREVEVRTPLTNFWWDFDGDGAVDSVARDPSWASDQIKRATVSLVVADEAGVRCPTVTREVPIGAGPAADVTVDDADPGATHTGGWRRSTSGNVFVGDFYLHDQDDGKGRARMRFRPDLPVAGRYRVCVAYAPHPNRAKDVPVTIHHRDGDANVRVDQTKGGKVFPFVPIGEYRFDAGTNGWLMVSNQGTDGFVVVDAARWIWLGE